MGVTRRSYSEIAERIGTDQGLGHAAVRAIVAHNVRAAKTDVAAKDLLEKWRAELGKDAYNDLTDLVKAARENGPLIERSIAPDEALSLAISHLSERASVFADHQILAEALTAGRGRVDFEAIKKEIESPEHGLIFGRTDAVGTRKATTRELLVAEHRALTIARHSVGICIPLVSRPDREPILQDSTLSDEQKQAVDKLLGSRDRVVMLLGRAGTGKSTLQSKLVSAIKRAGHSVIGCAPQVRQVAELKQMGLAESRTLASVLEKGGLPEGAVVLLDEAGQVGTLDFARLVKMVNAVKGRLILSGDYRQHGSVCAGDMLRLLSLHSGCDMAMITTIRRQKDELYKAARRKTEQAPGARWMGHARSSQEDRGTSGRRPAPSAGSMDCRRPGPAEKHAGRRADLERNRPCDRSNSRRTD